MYNEDRDILNEFEEEGKKIYKEGKNNQPSFFKKALCVTGCIILILIIVFLGILFYKNKIQVESITSVLLAFFSIFISLIFYLKADETSSKFYNNSYNFMKDISVTVGKIEERFGEKLNTMNEKLDLIEHDKQQTNQELQITENEKNEILNKFIETSTLTDEQKKHYKNELKKKEEEEEVLKQKLYNLTNLIENSDSLLNLSKNLYSNSNIKAAEKFIKNLSEDEINALNNGNISDIAAAKRIKANSLGLIENDSLSMFGKDILSLNNEKAAK